MGRIHTSKVEKLLRMTKRSIRGRPIRSRVVIKCPNIVEKDLTKRKAWGEAYPPIHEIDIEKKAWNKLKFRVYIHELTHCLLPDLTEKQVLKIEQIWGDILWNRLVRKFIKQAKYKIHQKYSK